MEDLHYVVSVCHTLRRHKYLTIWRPEDKGYCWPTVWAGRYDRAHVMAHLDYYNSGCSNVAVPCSVLDKLAVKPKPGEIDNDAGPCIPNTRATWKLILDNLIAVPRRAPLPEFKGAPRPKEREYA